MRARQVWQWLRHGAVVDGKQPLTAARFDQLLKEEMGKLRRCGGPRKSPPWQAGLSRTSRQTGQ